MRRKQARGSALRQLLPRLPQGSLGRSGIRLATLVLLLLSLSLLVSFSDQVVQGARMESRRRELVAEVEQIKAENQRLRAGADYAESDVYAERLARESLGYAREGDIVLLPQIAPPPPLLPPAPAALPPPPPVSNWLRWWHAFFP